MAAVVRVGPARSWEPGASWCRAQRLWQPSAAFLGNKRGVVSGSGVSGTPMCRAEDAYAAPQSGSDPVFYKGKLLG